MSDTVSSDISPSDAPLREPGTRARSGNAMLRTRAAILDAAAGCVERYGVRKTTMSDLATQAAVAKATLYNHFRTKDDVLAALVTSRVQALGATTAALAAGRHDTVPGMPVPLRSGLAAALEHAADELARCAPLRRVAAEEPAVLAVVAVPAAGRTWDVVRSAVVEVLEAADVAGEPPAVELVLRWLVSQATWPGTREEVALGAGLLERGLTAPRVEVPAQPATDAPLGR
ncbi:MAG: helix-turn-helix domain-containing protein [Mycobacteriales bacterium]|nr:helix-turn-helix domain-containing protein [Mycobacteriales bacterium]